MLPHQQQQHYGQTMAYGLPAQNAPPPPQMPPGPQSQLPPYMSAQQQGPPQMQIPSHGSPYQRMGSVVEQMQPQQQLPPPPMHQPEYHPQHQASPTMHHSEYHPQQAPPVGHHGPPPPQMQHGPQPPQPPTQMYPHAQPPLQHSVQHQHPQQHMHPQQMPPSGPPPFGFAGQPPPPPQMHQSNHPQMVHPPQPRLDLHAMPSVAQVTNEEISKCPSSISFFAPAKLPPLVAALEATQPNMEDGGCARPCHMRSTIYQVPNSKDKLQTSGLEFAVVINPFDFNETSGLYIPLSASQIIRCNRCKAYMNPYMEFVEGGRSFQCCICTHVNEVPQEYFSYLDHLGKRVDRLQRPELHLGSYEFKVTSEYYRKGIEAMRRPHIIFAIELTSNSKQMVHYVSKYLAQIIKEALPTDFAYSSSLSPLVAFVTYNSKIQLYDVVNGGHAYIISDMSAVTNSASTSKFLIDPNQNFEAIEQFLESLPSLCPEIDLETQTIFGPAIEAALKTCSVDTSNWFPTENGEMNGGTRAKKIPADKKDVIPTGKVYVFHASLPTYGPENTPGRLALKRNLDEMRKCIGTEKEKDILAPEGKYYNELAQKCVSVYGSGVELFLFPPDPKAFMNVATLGDLARLTGTGIINKYYSHSSPDYFVRDLKFSLKSTMGFDASMRVRTSTGISPSRYIGNFNNSMGGNLEMAAVNANSNFITILKYDDNLPENEMVVVQFAMIYTSLWGERRVRVHNMALGTCSLLADLFKTACCDTLVNVLVRDVIDKMRSGSLAPKTAKEQLTSKVISILAAYRKHCTENHSSNSSQLVLPEVLKLLPVYLCGALKCDAIDGGMEMFPDDKVLAQLNLLGSSPSLSQVTVYPKMYTIEASSADDENDNYGLRATLTRCYSLAIEEECGQCYVLENGYYLFIFFPSSELGQQFLADVYGNHKDDPVLTWESVRTESNSTKFLENLIDQIITVRRKFLNINIVRQGRDKLESIFKIFLYEDKKKQDNFSRGPDAFKLDNATYVEVLCNLHQEIRAKLQQ